MYNLSIFSFSMKRFLLKVILFTFLVLCLMSILDLFISSHLRTSTARIFAGMNYVYNDSTYHDLVINGNSRAWVQYNPKVLDSVLNVNSYNLGIDGSNVNRQIIKFNKYVEKHGYPKYLIQNIDLFTMEPSFGYEREQYFPYFFYDRDLLNDIDNYEHFTLMEKNILGYRYIGFMQSILSKLEYIPLYKGFGAKESLWDGTLLAEISDLDYSYDSSLLNKFDNFLEHVVLHGTKVIFVYAPIYHEVNTKCYNINEMHQLYQNIAAKFDIPILDYNDIPMCYDTTYFYNATHLNRVGADLFSTKLAHDMDSLRLLK